MIQDVGGHQRRDLRPDQHARKDVAAHIRKMQPFGQAGEKKPRKKYDR